jgi:hypothetical protein
MCQVTNEIYRRLGQAPLQIVLRSLRAHDLLSIWSSYSCREHLFVSVVVFPVTLIDRAQDATGVSDGDHVFGNIPCDNAARTDDRVLSDGDAR